MAATSNGSKIFFSLRKVGEVNPLDIQAMAVSTEFGESIDYSLEDSNQGLAEYRSTCLSDVVYCLLTGGNGSALAPEHSFGKELEVIAWSTEKASRIIKKVELPIEAIEQISEEIQGKTFCPDGFERIYGSLFSIERIEDRTIPLVD